MNDLIKYILFGAYVLIFVAIYFAGIERTCRFLDRIRGIKS